MNAAPPPTDAPEKTLPRGYRVALWFSVWFGCGYVPRAPGTMGSLGALPVYALATLGGPIVVFASGVLVTVIGIWSSNLVTLVMKKKDPQIIVIDEVAGVLLTLSVAPATTAGVVSGFVLFRLLDQVKPWPVRRFEHLPGGYGVMLDDVAAAAFAGVILLILQLGGVL